MTDIVNLAMTDIPAIADLVQVAPDSTVSRTVLTAEGARIVLFAFDAGQELTEHTAAVPVLLQALDGSFDITADGRTVRLEPGTVIHLGTRTPHEVVARQPSRLMLTMLDSRLT
jgi:quercetin dioxygenase-like cupin family protein